MVLQHAALAVPDDAIPFVLFQRTQYLTLPRHPLLYRLVNRLSQHPPLETAVRVESRMRRRAVARTYADDMQREFESIAPWLPEGATRILDIGCGVGGIDALLYRHYRAHAPDLYLLDRTETEKTVYYGFEEKGAFYNSLEITRELLLFNDVAPERIHLREARDDGAIDVHEPVDLIVSLLSWGFHYAMSTYLDEAARLLRPGGRLIVDARASTDGEELLRARFREVEIIDRTHKSRRFAALA